MNRTDPDLTPRHYRARLRLARLVLVWESLMWSASPAAGIVAAAVAAALLGVPQEIGQLFGPPVHIGLLIAVLALFLWMLRRAVVRFRVPDEAAARRRLETDSGLTHRPLTALAEQLANGFDPRAERLWQGWRRRLARSLADIRLGPPRPVLPFLDPLAFRAGIGIALVVGLVAARDDPASRLLSAVTPDFAALRTGRTVELDVWVDPPPYTGRPPMVLETGSGTDAAPVAVPVNSALVATVTGEGAPTVLVLGSGDSREAAPFEGIGERSYRIRYPLAHSVPLEIHHDGDALAQWTINVIPDLPPVIAFARPPAVTQRGSISVHYEAHDDYGLAEPALEIRLREEDGDAAEPVLERAMPPVGRGRTRYSGQGFHDLTPHPWAGRQVEMVLRMSDAAGQVGRSPPVRLTLPERTFLHPVARAVIEQRRRLLRRPEERFDVGRILLTLAARPHAYNNDTVAFLGLKSASERLRLVDDGAADQSVAELLWHTALRIEDGDLSIAAGRLRELERQLQEALAGNASDQEIRRLVDELKQALDEYLAAMAREMARQPQQAQSDRPQSGSPDDGVRREDLQSMLDRIRDMAETGARSQARQMLSQLQEMLENLRMNRPQVSPEYQALRQMMDQIGDMQRRQQELLDATYLQQRPQHTERRSGGRDREMRSAPGPQEQAGGMSREELARAQEQLRQRLERLIRRMQRSVQGMPPGFTQAEESMRRAVRGLHGQNPGDAVGPQADAIEQLQQGERALFERTAGQRGNHQRTRGNTWMGETMRDPLNPRRPGHGYDDQATVGIPEEMDFQKTRMIRDELHRRSGEIHRPRIELDYIDRLLKRF